MRHILLFLLLVCLSCGMYAMPQEKGRSNSFALPAHPITKKPPELKIECVFGNSAKSLSLRAGESANLQIVVTNIGEARADGVALQLAPSSKIDGVTFERNISVGAVDPSTQKVVAVTFAADKYLASQTLTITVNASETTTGRTFYGSFNLVTKSSASDQSIASEQTRTSQPNQDLPLQRTPQEKLSPAIRQLREKLASNPRDTQTRIKLVQLLFDEKLYGDVIADGEPALFIIADDGKFFLQLGESYRQVRKYAEALRALERGYNTMKSYSFDLVASYASALVQLGKPKWQEANLVLRKGAKEDQAFGDKMLASANRAFRAKDMELAANQYFAVLMLSSSKLTDDQKSFVQFNADLRGYVESHDPAEVTGALNKSLNSKLGPKLDYDEIVSTFSCLVTASQFEKARDFYNTVMALDATSTNQDTLDKKFLGLAYSLSSQCPEILKGVRIAFIRVVKNFFNLDDEEIKPIYQLHDFILSQGLANAASEVTGALLSISSDPRNRYPQLADIFVRYKRNDDAVATFRLALRKKGFDASPFREDIVQIYAGLLRSQKNSEAQQLLTKVNAIGDNDAKEFNVALADVFANAGQSEKSLNVLRTLVAGDPGNAVASARLGDALLKAQRYDEIVSSFASSATKEGKRYLALAYGKKGKLKEANQAWEEYRKLTTDPNELAEAKKHQDENLIAMFSADNTTPRQNAFGQQPGGGNEKVNVVIDSPKDGSQMDDATLTVTGKFIGAAPLKDIRINGKSVGTDRGMKVVDAQNPVSSTASGLPFSYVVSLNPGRNVVEIEATTVKGDVSNARIAVTLSGESSAKPMTAEQADGIRQNKAYAVIIGIGKYSDPEIPGLNYTVNDAQSLYSVLTDPNYGGFRQDHVTLLLNEKATTSAIKKAIGVDLKRAPEDGIAVVYFAGHGAPEGEQTYWLTYDTKISETLYASALSNDEITGMLKRINTNRVVTLLDCCYSGASIASTRSTRAVLVDDPFKAFEGSGSVTITSSNGKEQSLEDAKLKHGIFTYRLLEAIRGKADANGDGIVMADEIADYIQKTVPGDARERSHRQDPEVITNISGYIPVSRNPENAIKNSIVMQVQKFLSLYRDQKIDAVTFKKIKDILENGDEKARKPFKDYFDGVFTLSDLLEIIGK